MAYSLIPSELFLEKVKKLDKSIVIELEKKLQKIKETPVMGERRMHHAANYFRVYVRNFRLIYKVEESRIILFDLVKRERGYERFGD